MGEIKSSYYIEMKNTVEIKLGFMSGFEDHKK